jgi:CheY-like chemotaxis protein
LRRPRVIGHHRFVAPRSLVLVVDDDDDTRNCVCSVLEAEGYGVASARDGREALDLLARSARSDLPSLMLLDLMMPVMSGWDVLEALKKSPDLASIPVVVFTAAGEPTVSDRGLERPVLRKPIDLDLLLEMIIKICAAGWSVQAPPSDLLPKAAT